MPKSKVRKKPDVRPEHLAAPAEADEVSPRNRFQAIAGAFIAIMIVLSMLVSVFLPFINWR
jgi:hypothetical protein